MSTYDPLLLDFLGLKYIGVFMTKLNIKDFGNSLTLSFKYTVFNSDLVGRFDLAVLGCHRLVLEMDLEDLDYQFDSQHIEFDVLWLNLSAHNKNLLEVVCQDFQLYAEYNKYVLTII
jgi:hypothetical protein